MTHNTTLLNADPLNAAKPLNIVTSLNVNNPDPSNVNNAMSSNNSAGMTNAGKLSNLNNALSSSNVLSSSNHLVADDDEEFEYADPIVLPLAAEEKKNFSETSYTAPKKLQAGQKCPWCGKHIFGTQLAAIYDGEEEEYFGWIVHDACNNNPSQGDQ